MRRLITLLNKMRSCRITALSVVSLSILLAAGSITAVIAEGVGGGICSGSTDNFYDFNEQPVYTSGTQTGISFDFTSPYSNNMGAQIEVQWTAYDSSGVPTASFTSPFENANGTNQIWMIRDFNSPSTWDWIDASVTFTAPGMAQKYGHARGYNLASSLC